LSPPPSYHFWKDKPHPLIPLLTSGEGRYLVLLYNSYMNNQQKLEELEKKLVKYKAIFLEKKKVFRGVKHESSISELRYTEFMVYKNMVEGIEREIRELKKVV